jgi:hypothetical protein
MLATLVHNEKLTVFGDDDCVVTGDPGISNDQIFFHLAANAERAVV